MIRSAALYARVSTQIQAEHGHSLSSQIAACKEKAESIGAETVREYIDDGYSGAYLERPALDNMRDALRDHLHDAVVIYDPDRLSRNLAHQLLLTEEFEKLGVKLVFCSTDIQDTPEGKMLYQMRGVFASYEREKFRERSMRGKRALAKKGLFTQNFHIFGYDFNNTKREYIINEAEAKIVRYIFDSYMDGSAGGIQGVCRKLNRENIPSPKGKLWHLNTMRVILGRSMYCGEYYFGKVQRTQKDAHHAVNIIRPESEWIKIDCPAIITKDQFEKTQQKLEENKHDWKNHYTTTDILLRGLVYCPRCGAKERIALGSPTKKTPTRRRYYSCRRSEFGEQVGCTGRLIPVEILDEVFWKTLEEICSSQAKLSKYIGEKRQRQKKKSSPLEDVHKKLVRLGEERKTILAWFSKNLIEQNEATEKLQSIRQKEIGLKKKLETVKQIHEPDLLDAATIVKMVKSCPPNFDARRKLVLSIIDKVYAIRTDKTTYPNMRYEIDLKIVFKS